MSNIVIYKYDWTLDNFCKAGTINCCINCYKLSRCTCQSDQSLHLEMSEYMPLHHAKQRKRCQCNWVLTACCCLLLKDPVVHLTSQHKATFQQPLQVVVIQLSKWIPMWNLTGLITDWCSKLPHKGPDKVVRRALVSQFFNASKSLDKLQSIKELMFMNNGKNK